MSTQNYANHRMYVPMFHFVLFGLLVLTLIGSAVNLYQSMGDHERLYNASLILVLTICALMLFGFLRSFTMKVQDRAIRAEERLRLFLLTGKPADPKTTMRQFVALRFASDAEVVNLARRAVEENLSADAIKRAVKDWRADHDRA